MTRCEYVVRHNGGQPILDLRQGKERHVHKVVAVEVRIQNKVRGVAGVGDHRTHVGQEMEVTRLAFCSGERRDMGFQIQPFRLHNIDAEVFTVSLRRAPRR